MQLTDISYENWQPTKDTLHMFLQIVGKIKLKYATRRNHWWHITFGVTPRGITTKTFYINQTPVQIDFDFLQHKLFVQISANTEELNLADHDVAGFYSKLKELFEKNSVSVQIDNPCPFDFYTKNKFTELDIESEYDKVRVEEWFANLQFANYALKQVQAKFKSKISPVHVFWHSFDIATTFFTGNLGPNLDGADEVTKDAYSDEVISFGWWPGDHKTNNGAFYAYAAPSPDNLGKTDISKTGGMWVEQNGSPLAVLPNKALLNLEKQKQFSTISKFYELVYSAALELGGWSTANIFYEHAD